MMTIILDVGKILKSILKLAPFICCVYCYNENVSKRCETAERHDYHNFLRDTGFTLNVCSCSAGHELRA